MLATPVQVAMAALRAAHESLAACDLEMLTHRELLAALSELEELSRQLPTQSHRILARLAAEASPTELGATCLRDVLTERLRISRSEARRRLSDAEQLGPRTAFSGEPLDPVLARTAAAQSDGTIGPEHVRIVRTFMDRLPAWVDVITREQAECTLVRCAVGLGPDDLRKAADRLAALIDQDGPEPNDAERARRRHLTLGKQGSDGMSPITGVLDPQARATLEAVFAKWAAPGMCNPEDTTPCVSGTPSQAQIDTDTRSAGQRLHDAFTAIGRNALSSGELGRHNGLPVTIIVSTTLEELESGCGWAVTGGGSLLPMSDVIRMSSHAHHYLAIYSNQCRAVPLYFGRSKRVASPGQRLVLHDRDRGCTFPGCPVPGYGSQVHHVRAWARDGESNIDEEVLACGPHNRLAENGWQVTIRKDGVVEWIPPPLLDGGRARTNTYHHPQRMLAEPDDENPDCR
jgi:hypothetical protein